jgi:hypothetical protein
VPQDRAEAAAWYGRLTNSAAAKFALNAITSREDSEGRCGAIGATFRMARGRGQFPDFSLSLLCSSY